MPCLHIFPDYKLLTGLKILYFLSEDIFKISNKTKKKTLRGLNIDLNINDVLKCGIMYKKCYFAKIKITNKQKIEDYTKLNYKIFNKLGYSKKEYLKKPYNQKENKERFLYTFEILELNLNEYFSKNY